MGWVISAMPWQLYTQKSTQYPLYRKLGGPRAGLEGCRRFSFRWDSIPAMSSP